MRGERRRKFRPPATESSNYMVKTGATSQDETRHDGIGGMSDDSTSNALAIQDYWRLLPEVQPDPRHLARRHVITAARRDPAHANFDLLRTRMMQALQENQWSRVGISSPTEGCGKTVVAANLAFSQALRPNTRTVLFDLDLRNPELAATLGVGGEYDMVSYLAGHIPPDRFFLRTGENLALGLNTRAVAKGSELLQETMTGDVLEEMGDLLMPDVVLYDLPPVLGGDEVLGFASCLDAVLLVVGGGVSRDEEVREAEALLQGQVPLLGVVLNKAQE